MTKTLTKITLLRQRFGDGQIPRQQQPIRTPALLLIALVASILFLGVALGVGSLFSPSFLAVLQQTLSVLVIPFLWLFGSMDWLFAFRTPPAAPDYRGPSNDRGIPPEHFQRGQGYSEWVTATPTVNHAFRPGGSSVDVLHIAIIAILVAAGILLVLLCLCLWLKRKRLPRKARRRDRRESIWSWGLFWAQLLRQVLRRFFSRLGKRAQRRGNQNVEKRSELAADFGLARRCVMCARSIVCSWRGARVMAIHAWRMRCRMSLSSASPFSSPARNRT